MLMVRPNKRHQSNNAKLVYNELKSAVEIMID